MEINVVSILLNYLPITRGRRKGYIFFKSIIGVLRWSIKMLKNKSKKSMEYWKDNLWKSSYMDNTKP